MEGVCCNGCNNNYFGVKCENQCLSHCVPNSSGRSCYTDGTCINGCVGLTCDTTCPTNCAPVSNGSSCSSDHKCINRCSWKFYGPAYDIICPTNCAIVYNGSTCFSDAICINGCKLGYGGKQCNIKCSETCEAVASGSRCSDNGSCAAGCIDGYLEERCDISKVRKNNTDDAGTSLENTGGQPVPVIAGSVGGVVELIVIGVVITFVIMRKRRSKEPSDQFARFDEDQPTSTNEYHTIGTLPERSTVISHSHVIANPNYDPSKDVLSLRRNGDNLQSESDTDTDVLEIVQLHYFRE
ncbi:hypothetical protein DPMN_015555 [Dreissena polymorpha]|uniref:4Fe-4S ferredoxin-type domain-containing protein n=1 Tax=Dreissena polymorpha TaxID=45954 RepID=A0A9D4N7Z4_DREPO|nr:hypothetical protein DPMN_015555 [Dreissena polymorpha]